jgi:chromosome segregation ATPase
LPHTASGSSLFGNKEESMSEQHITAIHDAIGEIHREENGGYGDLNTIIAGFKELQAENERLRLHEESCERLLRSANNDIERFKEWGEETQARLHDATNALHQIAGWPFPCDPQCPNPSQVKEYARLAALAAMEKKA